MKYRGIHTAEVEQALFKDPFIGKTQRTVQVDSSPLRALGQHEDGPVGRDDLRKGEVVRLLQNRS